MARGGARPNTGGAREGAGQPPGPIIKRSRKAANKLASDEEAITPLEVMVLTMREMWGDGSISLDQKKEACVIAEKCAPYLHPRLASTQVKADINQSLNNASIDDLKAEIKALLADL